MADFPKRSPILFRMLILSGAVLIFLVIYSQTQKDKAPAPLQQESSSVPSYPIHTDMKTQNGFHDRMPVYTFHATSYPDHPVNRMFKAPVFSVFDETKNWKLSPPRFVPEEITSYWIVPHSITPDVKSALLMLQQKKYKYAHSGNVDIYAISLTSRKAVLLLKEMRARGLLLLPTGYPDVRSNFFYGTGEEPVQLQMFFFFCK